MKFSVEKNLNVMSTCERKKNKTQQSEYSGQENLRFKKICHFLVRNIHTHPHYHRQTFIICKILQCECLLCLCSKNQCPHTNVPLCFIYEPKKWQAK